MADANDDVKVEYNSDSNTLTVKLPFSTAFVGAINFDVHGVPTQDIKCLVVEGVLGHGNFPEYSEQSPVPWQNRFVKTPRINLTNVQSRCSVQAAADLDHDETVCLWTSPDVLLPLYPLKPKEFWFPLETVEITYFENNAETCAWDLSELEATNLAELLHLQSMSQSFNDLPKLRDVALPKCARTLHDCFNRCKNLETFEVPKGSTLEVLRYSLCQNQSLTMATLHFNTTKDCEVWASVNTCDKLSALTHSWGHSIQIFQSFHDLGIKTVTIPSCGHMMHAFEECHKLTSVTFLPSDNTMQIHLCFNNCAIRTVHGFEYVCSDTPEYSTEIDGFQGNPLQYIAIAPTVTRIDPEFAKTPMHPANGYPSHLDMSRVARLGGRDGLTPEGAIDDITHTGRGNGFDHVWLPNLDVGDSASLWAVLYCHTHTGSVVHCARGKSKEVERAMKAVDNTQSPQHRLPKVRFTDDTKEESKRDKLELLRLIDQTGFVPTTLMSIERHGTLPRTRPHLPPEMSQEILLHLLPELQMTGYIEPTEPPQPNL
jgi:hypothetical protein